MMDYLGLEKNQMYCFLIKILFQEPEFIAPAVAILDSWLFTWQTQGAKWANVHQQTAK